MKKSFCGLLMMIVMSVINCQTKIPKHLRECYTNETLGRTEIPMNLQVLIDIIRKVEKYSLMSIDMRTMASSLLHRFKFDGVEYNKNIKLNNNGVLPFGGTGAQRIKNQIIEELIPGNIDIFPSNALTIFERCALHRAMSNTIWEEEMPGTNKFCENKPVEKISEGLTINGGKKCPLEQGVILTPFGTIAPGTIIAAVAAALQPQNVTVRLLLNITDEYDFNEDQVDFVMPKNQMDSHKSMWFTSIISSTAELDNIWLATVAGELAELAVYQGPVVGHQMILGATGFWNSTMRPTRYYLEKDINFDVTRAEIVGAIDGFIIAKNLPLWISQFNNLRLSQILDMYYSSKGPTTFDSKIRACERGKSFWHVASRTTMEEQTYTASQILAYHRSVAHMTDDVLFTMTNYAVNKFTNYVSNNLFSELRCLSKKINHPHIEAFVVFDGAWSVEYTADFLTVLLEDLDVSMYGSKIGFLHGNNGEWILNITASPALAHESIANFTSLSWPTALNLLHSFNSIENYLTNSWNERHKNYTIGGLGQVIIILAPLLNLDSVEQEIILPSLKSLRDNHPDVNIVYYTIEGNSKSFKHLLLSEKDYLIVSSNINDITDYLLTIPRSLRPGMCKKNTTNMIDQFEDYIEPYEKIIYRLDSRWRIDTENVTMKIVSVGYGTLEICWWNQYGRSVKRDKYFCRELSGHNELIISDIFLCKKNIECPTIFYQVRGMLSLKKCAEMDCRRPDFIRYLMRMENLQCSNSEKSSSNSFIILIIIQLFIFT